MRKGREMVVIEGKVVIVYDGNITTTVFQMQ